MTALAGAGGSLRAVRSLLRGQRPTDATAVRVLVFGLVAGVMVDVSLTLVAPAQPGRTAFLFWVGAFLVLQVVYLTHAERAFEDWPGMLVPLGNIVCFAFAGSYGPSHLWYAAAIPAAWLGLHFGYRGLAATTAVTVGFVSTVVVAGLAGFDLVDKPGAELLMFWLATTAGGLPTAIAQASFAQTGRSLISTRRLQESIVDSVDVGIMHVDESGRVVSMNRQMELFRSLALPGGPGAPEHSSLFTEDGVTPLPPEDFPIRRVLEHGSYERMQLWAGEDPMRRRALEVTARRLTDDHGRGEGAALAAHDVTTLVHAMKVKDQFVSSVSHELRTPLTSIIGYLELVLEDEELDDLLRKQLDRVHHNATRLRTLVEDLLSTAQDPAVHLRDPRPVDLADLVVPVTEALAVEADDRGVSVDWRADHAPVHGDPKRLEQVLVNLVSNAVKYTPHGGRVDVESGMHEGESFVRVRDTGIGLDEDEQTMLFQRFFRADAARRAAIPGVGLGLAISRDIVQAHGGRIGVVSSAGAGSTFEVRFPARSNQAAH